MYKRQVEPSVVMHSTIRFVGAYIPAAVAVSSAGAVVVWAWISAASKAVS